MARTPSESGLFTGPYSPRYLCLVIYNAMPPLRTGYSPSGLVSIPVQLHTATKDQRIAFHLLHAKYGSRIQNRYHCLVCNVTVERDDRVRGYEFAKDQYVQFTEAELESLETESSNNIELKEFIPLSKIDPVCISRIHTTSVSSKSSGIRVFAL